MKESFLCYESGDSLFLIMLDAVLHILEAPANGQECVKFQDQEIPVQDFCRRFGGWPREESRYAVLLKAGEILGVCELEVERFKVLPREVRGQANAFLQEAAWVETAGSYGFLVDSEKLF